MLKVSKCIQYFLFVENIKIYGFRKYPFGKFHLITHTVKHVAIAITGCQG